MAFWRPLVWRRGGWRIQLRSGSSGEWEWAVEGVIVRAVSGVPTGRVLSWAFFPAHCAGLISGVASRLGALGCLYWGILRGLAVEAGRLMAELGGLAARRGAECQSKARPHPDLLPLEKGDRWSGDGAGGEFS